MLLRRQFLGAIAAVGASCTAADGQAGEIIEAYATGAGEPSLDASGDQSEPFATALISALAARGATAQTLLSETRSRTIELTRGVQTPVWPADARDFPVQYGAGAGPALLLMFSEYTSATWQPLNGVERASGRLADAFDAAGFTTTLGLNLATDEIREILSDFARQSANARQAIIYCSGHGVLVGATQYVIPVDVDVENGDALQSALRWRDIASANRAHAGLTFWGGCRDNPLGWSN